VHAACCWHVSCHSCLMMNDQDAWGYTAHLLLAMQVAPGGCKHVHQGERAVQPGACQAAQVRPSWIHGAAIKHYVMLLLARVVVAGMRCGCWYASADSAEVVVTPQCCWFLHHLESCLLHHVHVADTTGAAACAAVGAASPSLRTPSISSARILCSKELYSSSSLASTCRQVAVVQLLCLWLYALSSHVHMLAVPVVQAACHLM
jgi:hypothetical protein